MRALFLMLLLAQGGPNMAGPSVAAIGGKIANGRACLVGNQCVSGNCVDSVCCDTACAGACDACSVAAGASVNGTCALLPAGNAGSPSCSPYLCTGASASCGVDCDANDDAKCVSSYWCDAAQTPDTCVADGANGAACGVNGDCTSGFCAQGVCCNTACNGGACQSCLAAATGGSDGTCAFAQAGYPGSPTCTPDECDGTAATCPGGSIAGDYDWAIMNGRLGVSSPNFCTYFASEMTGSYFCWDADGTGSTGASITLTGSPTQVSKPMCPNGSDCDNITMYEFDGTTQYGASPASTAPLGDFTACTFFDVDVKNGGSTESIMRKGTDTSGAESFFMTMLTSGIPQWGVSKASGTTTSGSGAGLATGDVMANVPALICLQYDYITDGTSKIRGTWNGTEIYLSTAAVGPPTASLSNSVDLFRRGAAANDQYMGGHIRYAFFTEKYVPDASITLMDYSLRPRPWSTADTTFTVGRTLTTGAGPQYCVSADETKAAPEPIDYMCVNADGIRSQQGGTTVNNVVIRGDAFDNAAWTATSGSVSANFARAPDGTLSAEKFTSTGGLAGNLKSTSFVAGSGASILQSVFMKSETGSSISVKMRLYDTTTAGYVGSTCTKTVTTSWKRYTCAHSGLSTTDSLNFVVEDNGTGNAWDVWGANANIGGITQDYHGTTTAASSPGRENVTIANPVSNATEGCISFYATFPPDFAGAMDLVTNGTIKILYLTDDLTVKMQDGTNTSLGGDLTGAGGGSVAGRTVRFTARWQSSGAVMAALVGAYPQSQVGAGTFDGSMGTMTTLRLGSVSSSATFRHATFENIRVGDSITECDED